MKTSSGYKQAVERVIEENDQASSTPRALFQEAIYQTAYLGVELDNRLTWSHRINQVTVNKNIKHCKKEC